ncbi:biopolymer transporter ExbD [Pseudorhodobacter sp.]|uniref:ExbD/TolR family protein n=1 Tax=Pseudorhodobacter sp. TaxID=1934400 RepID=UPI002AFF937F|nr:biopolymer transporter ExbD [Pseudorhodobacter sp.]
MRFARPSRRAMPESVVPMINVVFLLLIFFLMSARLAPPPPVDIDLPYAGSDKAADDALVLYLGESGVAMLDMVGDAVWQRLATVEPGQTLTLRADAALPGVDVAKTLSRLAGLGLTQVELSVRAK